MSPTPITAAPGTHILTKLEDGTVAREPVVFWDVLADDGRPQPHTLDGVRHIMSDDAVQFPDGSVVTGDSSFALLSVAQWAGGDAAATPARAPASAQKVVTGAPALTGLPFPMTGKRYARKSFWSYEDEGEGFVFELDADVNSPDHETVTKITRDDFKSSTLPSVNLADMADTEVDEGNLGDDEDDDIGDMV